MNQEHAGSARESGRAWMRIVRFVCVAVFAALALTAVLRLAAHVRVQAARETSSFVLSDLAVLNAPRAQLRMSSGGFGDPLGRWWSEDSGRGNSRPNSARDGGPSGVSQPAADERSKREGRSLGGHLKQVVETVRASSDNLFGLSLGHSVRAGLIRQIAERELDQERRILLYCEALSQYGASLRHSPRDARLLMSWANLRQTLGSYACQAPHTDGDYRAVLHQAVSLDPTNVTIKYAAALVLLWGGERSEAFRYLFEVLRFGTSITSRQEQFIFERVKDIESLRALIPARFPQILQFSRFIAARPPIGRAASAEKEFLSTLAEMQADAIRESAASYDSGMIPFEVHFERLVDMLPFAYSVAVRQLIDKHLTLLTRLKGDTLASKYLSERSELRSLAVVPATLSSDTRPARTSLADWGWVGDIALDDFYRSIGFYLAADQTPRVIEIRVPTRPSDALLKSIHVYHSADNQGWTEVTEAVSMEYLSVGRSSVIVLRVPSRYRKYWKIHFARAERDGILKGRLRDLISVYGLSLLEEDSSWQ